MLCRHMADASPQPLLKTNLSLEQQAQALALFEHLVQLNNSGVRQVLLTLGETIGVGQVSRRIDIPRQNRSIIGAANN